MTPLLLRRARLVVATALVFAAGFTATTAVQAAYTASTSTSGAAVATGTVAVGHDAGINGLSITDGAPGDSSSGCVTVTTTGTLPSELRHYATSAGTIVPYLDVRIVRGTSPAGRADCADFTPDTRDHRSLGAGVVHDGPLTALGTDWASGIADPATSGAGAEDWTAGEVHTYRVTVTVRNDLAAASRTGTASLTWEARSR